MRRITKEIYKNLEIIMKIKDSINSLEDLDEFTSYVLDPKSNDNITDIGYGSFETEKMSLNVRKGLEKQVQERLLEIVRGELEFIPNLDPIVTGKQIGRAHV